MSGRRYARGVRHIVAGGGRAAATELRERGDRAALSSGRGGDRHRRIAREAGGDRRQGVRLERHYRVDWVCEWYGNSTEVYTREGECELPSIRFVGCVEDDGSDVGELGKGQRLKERGKAEEDGDPQCGKNDEDEERLDGSGEG